MYHLPTIDRGTDYRLQFTWYRECEGDPPTVEHFDLTGFQALLVLRKREFAPAVLTLDETAGITLGPDGTIVMELDEVQSLIPAGRYLYDLYLTSPAGITRKLLQGLVSVAPRMSYRDVV
ncbi:MAG: hypothetical protein U0795_00710 [Pirellulales bacterium]